MLTLSHIQAHTLLQARQDNATTVEVSPDLNLTLVPVRLAAGGVHFPDDEHLTWAQLEQIALEENKCFTVRAGHLEEIRVFSPVTNWTRSLYPTQNAPTTLVSGIPMHRIKDIDPHQDTLRKIKAARPTGQVLDTATGLGYTAIEAARTAEHVLTVEIDPAALEIARLNPWSQDLFDNPKIEIVIADVLDLVEDTPDARYSVIIHDPPAFNLAGDLYSGAFYAELHRILKPRGRLFHYVGDPNSKSGRNVTHGVNRRLQEAGFTRITKRPEAFGLLAYK